MSLCKKCGDVLDKHHHCKECTKKVTIEWRKQNKEKKLNTDRKYRATHKKEFNELRAKWRAKNAQKEIDAQAKFRKENPEKIKEYKKRYYKKNGERALELSRKSSRLWQALNVEKVRKTRSARRLANPGVAAKALADWHATHPMAARTYNNNRRAKLNGGKLSKGLGEKLFKLQKGKCVCCGEPLGSDYHFDHTMPLILGGANTDNNIQLLRKKCNLQKNAKHPIVFMQSRGFLL